MLRLDPARTLQVFLSSFLPVLVGTGASPDPYTEWTDGYFVRLATGNTRHHHRIAS